MKQATSFRLSTHAIHLLTELEKKLDTTKTDVIEQALEVYAELKKSKRHPLAKFAGVLSETEAKNMLKNIKSSRRNKNKDTAL